MIRIVLPFMLTLFCSAGCVSSKSSHETAVPLDADVVNLGRVVVLSTLEQQVPAITQTVDATSVYETACETVAAIPGTYVVSPDSLLGQLPPRMGWRDVEMNDLMIAARSSGADTLCVVDVSRMTRALHVGFLPPGWQVNSTVDFEFALLDVETGTTLTDTHRRRTTEGYLALTSRAEVLDGFAAEIEQALSASEDSADVDSF